MRIGIVTIHHVTNYGAVLQAYALSQALKQTGAKVEILDYRPENAVRWYRQRLWQGRRPNLRGFLWQRSFERFVSEKLPIGPTVYRRFADLVANPPTFDVLVAGSDQIWCTGQGSFRGFDPAFFLDFSRGQPTIKISYAASAGDTKDFSEHTAAVRRSLKEFAEISVRDESTAALIQRTTGRTASVVVDPVFLHDFNDLAGDVTPQGELVVFSTRPQRFERVAKEIAAKHDLKVVTLLHRCSIADEHRGTPSPQAWLRHMKSARVVLTDYFHGAAIATHFGIPFLADAPAGKVNKINDLLHRSGLSDALLGREGEPPAALRHILDDIDGYADVVRSSMSDAVKASRAFLMQAITARGEDRDRECVACL